MKNGTPMLKISPLIFIPILTCFWATGQPAGQIGSRNGPASFASFSNLMRDSNVIVVATTASVVQSGSRSTVDLRVVRSLQGSLIPGASILLDLGVPGDSTSTGSVALWFLRETEGTWTALPQLLASSPNLTDYFLPVPVASPFTGRIPADPKQAVVNEIASALGAVEGALISPVQVLGLAQDLPQQLGVGELFRNAADGASTRTQALGIGGLILLGNSDGYPRLLAWGLLSDAKSPETGVVAMAICNSPRDSTAVEALGQVVARGAPLIARCAAQVLRGLHTREALPYLAGLLDSESLDLRYEGVVGLASFANNLPVHKGASSTAGMGWMPPLPGVAPYATEETRAKLPSITVFLEQENAYTSFWKTWWQLNQARIQGR